MKQTHKNCQDPKCKVCLEDHLAVGTRLDELCGDTGKHDHMGRFHSWLTKQGLSPETEHGWGTAAFFDDDNIAKYAEEFLRTNSATRINEAAKDGKEAK